MSETEPSQKDDGDVPILGSDEPKDDTSGGPLSSGAGEGSGQGAEAAPDVDVPGGADDENDAPRRRRLVNALREQARSQSIPLVGETVQRVEHQRLQGRLLHECTELCAYPLRA
jgi:hypothetical protein